MDALSLIRPEATGRAAPTWPTYASPEGYWGTGMRRAGLRGKQILREWPKVCYRRFHSVQFYPDAYSFSGTMVSKLLVLAICLGEMEKRRPKDVDFSLACCSCIFNSPTVEYYHCHIIVGIQPRLRGCVASWLRAGPKSQSILKTYLSSSLQSPNRYVSQFPHVYGRPCYLIGLFLDCMAYALEQCQW